MPVKSVSASITPENVVRHELIGLRVRVAESTDPMLRGLNGTVVDETHNMLVIETKRAGKPAVEKRLSKQNSVFIFALPNKVKVKVDGRLLVGRPEDRVKKRFDRW